MTRKRKADQVIVVNPDAWYAVAYGSKPFLEECCDCGLVHRIDYKVEGGKFWVRYQRDEVATRKARARRQRSGE